MPILDDLRTATTDAVALDLFVNDNFQELYDYFNWRTDEELGGHLMSIREYLTRKRTILLALPTTDYNLSFLALLLEVSERLSLPNPFSYLYKFLIRNNYEVGARLHASSKFLIDVDNAALYLQRFFEIHDDLKSAIIDELDNADKVLTTMVNYYVKAIADFGEFNINVANEIKSEIELKIKNDENSFLNRPLIWDILKTDLADYEAVQIHIHQLLDEFLQRGIEFDERVEGYLIEDGSAYAASIISVDTNFNDIRGISLNNYRNCNSDEIYESLQRGVQIITNECQLFGYMYSFGKMHFQKLYDAFSHLPPEIFDHPINMIDWGCGQGMATMVLLEYLSDENIEIKSAQNLLIEPSQLALKRAALHIKKFNPEINVSTINKGLEELNKNDFKDLVGTRHLHLFSNILDIDFFPLTQLINLIKERFTGINYFVIVSPYVNDTKKIRIDSFVRAFAKNTGYTLLGSNTNAKNTWIQTWTRIERVFCAELE
jgi:hypothetical protein